ncbi:MAG: phosphotransferase [Pseudomonadales bacterium]|jgi:hypothetical protein|nr:phosphotransferase [Pseudomonadales bacterium]
METEHISQEELARALQCDVRSFTVYPIQASPRGYMADVYRLKVNCGEETRSVIMKKASQDPERRSMAERFGSYINERRFYGELAHELPFRTPECYHSATDRFLLLLQDLGDEGTVSTSEGASEGKAASAIATLARIHAHFQLNPPEQLQGIETGLVSAVEDMQSFVLDSLQNFSGREQARTLAHYYARNSLAYVSLFTGQDQVFTHMDYRLDNLRFLDDVIVLDWGESNHAPAGFDLASFMAGSLAAADRRQWESGLLDLYCDTLRNSGVACHRQEILDSYRLALLPSLYLPGLVFKHGDPGEGELLLDRHLAAIGDHYTYLSGAREKV